MRGTPEQINEILHKIDQALNELVALRMDEGAPFMVAWAMAYEFTDASLESEANTMDGVIVPPNQSRSASRGVFELGLDHFTRTS